MMQTLAISRKKKKNVSHPEDISKLKLELCDTEAGRTSVGESPRLRGERTVEPETQLSRLAERPSSYICSPCH